MQENWENCLVSQQAWFSFQEIMMVELPVSPQELNLSYQDLGDPFQWESFLRILRRLIRVENLQLVSDSLSDLSSVRLPRLTPHYPECTTATVRETQSQSYTSLLVSFFVSSLLLNSLQPPHTHTTVQT